MARRSEPFPDVSPVWSATLSIWNAKNHENLSLKTNFESISGALAWPLALTACLVLGSQALAAPLVEPLSLGQSVLNVSQGQLSFARPSITPLRLAPPPLELSKSFAGASRKSPVPPPALNPETRAADVSLPAHAVEGWGSDSSAAVAGVYTPSLRLSDWQELARANQGLSGGVFKELVGSNDVKTALPDLRVELKKFVGGTVFEVAGPDVPDTSQTKQAEINSLNAASTRMREPPPSAAEQATDSLRASVMFWQLIEEVTPWAFSALFLYWSCLTIRSYLRMQARRRISALQARSRRHKRWASRTARPTSTILGSRPES